MLPLQVIEKRQKMMLSTLLRMLPKLAKRIKELNEPFFATWMCRSSMYGLFAKDEDIERFHKRYQKPVKVLAQERYERLMKLA